MKFFRRELLILLNALALKSVALPISRERIGITHGFSIGEVTDTSAIVWARVGAEIRLAVQCGLVGMDIEPTTEIISEVAQSTNDYTIKINLKNLSENARYHIRCFAIDENGNLAGQVLTGTFKTAQRGFGGNIRFCWSGDTCGQGYGIDKVQGGMLTYKSMYERSPDFFIHCGDQIYADNPLQPEKKAEGGLIWRNWLSAGKAKVAETLQEFRDNFYYNFNDPHFCEFHRNVAVYHMWDDHEVVNNWYPGEQLDDDRYQLKDVNMLAARAARAFVECLPVDPATFEKKPLYRKISRGGLLDLFFVDLRSYRSANSENEQRVRSDETRFFGDEQLEWLKIELAQSNAIWKIVCTDMPISVFVKEWGTNIAENAANSDGPPAGRELEYLDLFSFIKEQDIKNVHFITADIHYCASYHCSPNRAQTKNFKPFWEFVSGPLHAGTFGPNELDNSFGPKAEFIGLPETFEQGCSPASNLQFFGEMEIESATKKLKVTHFNRIGDALWQLELEPEI